MMEPDPHTYCERRSGRLAGDPTYARGFLDWSANTRSGRWATDLVLRQKWVNGLYGWYHKRPISRRKIKPFVERMGVDVDASVRCVDDFDSFNDFFTRQIDLCKRSIDSDPAVCSAPADGRVLAFREVDAGHTFRIKRSTFNLREFLDDPDLTARFDGGSMVISRLCLADYHHFHFPDSGTPGPTTAIRGKYYPSSPYAVRSLVPFYAENHRVQTPFESDHFGQVLLVEVGAFTVGSIRQCYRPGWRVTKGARKGHFELGGSTAVMLFQKDTIVLDNDLCLNTASELETRVRMGESVGRSTKCDDLDLSLVDILRRRREAAHNDS